MPSYTDFIFKTKHVLCIHKIRILSRKRLLKRKGRIFKNKLNEIKEIIKSFILFYLQSILTKDNYEKASVKDIVLIGVAVAAVITLIIFGYFYYQKDVDQLDAWKTYRNEKYGFEFKYPAKLGQPSKASERVLNCDSRTYNSVSLVGFSNLGIDIACLNILEDAKRYKGSPKEAIIATKKSQYFEYVSATGYFNKEIFILFDDKYVVISYTYKPGRPDYIEIKKDDWNQIISPFKFIK